MAIKSLELYTSAVLEGNLLPPPKPKECWREVMEQLPPTPASTTAVSCAVIRISSLTSVPHPGDGARQAAARSRPSKRKPNGGVESLRAIPWIFAWTQNRLMLPAWLGAHKALQQAIDGGKLAVLEEMSGPVALLPHSP